MMKSKNGGGKKRLSSEIHKKKALLTLFVLFFMGIGVVMAQTQVRGTVVDEYGDPVIGATVQIRGTTQGTATDLDGVFTLSAPANGMLVVSYVGYTVQEVPVSANMHITLVPDSEMLDELVVTALGMARDRRALGYAITEISGENIIRSSVTNPVNALQGRVAGVQINMGAAGPQSSQRILIRGNTSLSPNSQPIFIIDGVLVDNDVTATGGWADRDFGNALKNLNSDDFESVTVLKGAAATALYGSRASNGVILITTKRGSKSQGLGINFSHTQQWDHIYRFPSFQNEFGTGTIPVWDLDNDRRDIRVRTNTPVSFGPRFDGLEYTASNPNGADYRGIYRAYEDNVRAMYQTGRFVNTNVAVSGGTETGAFRFSYSNLQQTGLTLNNEFTRNNFALTASQNIGSIVTASAGFTYTQSEGRNPTFQGDRFSPMYDFSYNIPRLYDAHYWRNNYWNANRDGWSTDDPWGMTSRFFEFLENNQIQREENYRGNIDLGFKLTDWLRFNMRGTMNRSYIKFENKQLANANNPEGTQNFGGSFYRLNERQNLQYSGLGMFTATHTFGDFYVSASAGAERWHQDQAINNSWTDGGLLVPGLFQLSNSVRNARTEAFAPINQRRINSVFGFINTSWRDQIYLDITGRNDWSSTLRYVDGTGNVSYFYPSFSTSWIATESLRGRLPQAISFAKLRASYAIVGKDADPYLITDPGSYTNLFGLDDTKFNTGRYPVLDFLRHNDSYNLGASNLKPELQHAIEFGLDARFFNHRLGIDATYYKTNTYNQILLLPMPQETGVDNRVINAGNIQNQGVEILLTGTVIRRKNLEWDLGLNFTRNRNKIVDLHAGVPMFRLLGGSDVASWATVGGTYGDLYSNFAFLRDDDGNKLLNAGGQFIRSGTNEKIGNSLPSFLGGFTSDVRWKNLSFTAVIDSRFGGDIWSGSFNYGMERGQLQSSLRGRPGHGGLERTLTDGRTVFDGMIPDGVYRQGSIIGGRDVSGMSYQEAYDAGIVPAMAASTYYSNLYSWGSGIREASVQKLTWVALRELSVNYDLPQTITSRLHIQNAAVGITMRNVGYLYNSLPDRIHPEGLRSNHSAEFQESGGNVYSRSIGMRLNLTF
ncbi:MAG: SusC/RagA family TonB-linked outer membrane protein [Dysgonamonadaceae bacterium]|jgi:iron complex outermembrane receptor protein|nr:SusC/RagA family TonB-linked outer membrane protein [Dysgonamonadaceae bacterium]